MAEKFDVAVVGGGIAGLTAAHHAGLGGCHVVHIMGTEAMGGLVCNVGELHGFPAEVEPVSGIGLAAALSGSNAELDVEQVFAEATSITRDGTHFSIATSEGKIPARQVIVATGARLRMLEVPGAETLLGRGISQCAWCDGVLYKGREVVVVGGGDAALEEALHLADHADKITVVTHGDGLRARQSYIDRIADLPSVSVRLMSDVTEILGGDSVEAIRLHDHTRGEAVQIQCDGVFVFIGLRPNGSVIEGIAAFDSAGAALTSEAMQTKTPGLFAIGAVRSGYRGRLVHAVADGATAAMEAVANISA